MRLLSIAEIFCFFQILVSCHAFRFMNVRQRLQGSISSKPSTSEILRPSQRTTDTKLAASKRTPPKNRGKGQLRSKPRISKRLEVEHSEEKKSHTITKEEHDEKPSYSVDHINDPQAENDAKCEEKLEQEKVPIPILHLFS